MNPQAGKVTLKIRKSDPLSKVEKAFLAIARDKKWLPASSSSSGGPPTGFKITFDSDRVDLEESPESLGIEEGDALDITWK